MNLNDKQKKDIEKYHESGYNSTEISTKLKIDKQSVDLYIIDKYFIENKKSQLKLTKDKAIYLVKEYYNGNSFDSICKKLGFCSGIWTKVKKRLNLDFKPSNCFDYSFWTKSNIKKLIFDFNSGIPIYKLVHKYGFHKNALAKIINENGGNTTPITFNNTIFNKIDTEEKAYWLGFLYADGSVSSFPRNTIELSLQLLDANHLDKFKSFLNSSNNIKLDFKVKRCRFSVCNKQFKTDLIKNGCTPKKSLILTFPSENIVPKNLQRHFIRGYFDGDGCLSHTYSDTKKKRFTISTSMLGTKNFCKSVKKILQENKISCNWYHNKKCNENIWSIDFNKNNSVKLLNYLYENASVYLERKYLKYKFFKEHKNFAVYVSDYIDYDRAISVKAKQWINDNFNIDVDSKYANTEITKKSKDFLVS